MALFIAVEDDGRNEPSAPKPRCASWEMVIMKVIGGLLFLFGAFSTTDVAFAVEYRWIFAMGAGSESAQIENSAGSQIIISCLSGNQFNIPTIDLESKKLSKSANQSDLYVQFVIDGKNFSVSFKQGTAAPGSRNRDNENGNFITALNDAKSKSFTAEYPDLQKREKFSTLNVRDAVGAIVEGCLNAPIENQK